MRKHTCPCEAEDADPNGPRHYKVVRMFLRGGRRTIKSGLTLADAQAHCEDPETSSRTATSAKAKRYTAWRGEWFDGYDHI